MLKGFFDIWMNVMNGTYTSTDQIINAIWDVFVGFFEGIGIDITALKDQFFGAMTFMFDTAKNILNAIRNVFETVFNGILDFINWIVESIIGAFESIGQGISNAFNDVLTFFEDIIEQVSQIASDIGNWITESVNGLIEGIHQFFKPFGDLLNTIIGGLQDAWNTFVTWVKDLVSPIGEFFSNMWNNGLKPILENVWNAMKSVGQMVYNVFGGAIDAIMGVFRNVKQAILDFLEPLLDIAEKIPGIGGVIKSIRGSKLEAEAVSGYDAVDPGSPGFGFFGGLKNLFGGITTKDKTLLDVNAKKPDKIDFQMPTYKGSSTTPSTVAGNGKGDRTSNAIDKQTEEMRRGQEQQIAATKETTKAIEKQAKKRTWEEDYLIRNFVAVR